METVVFLWGTSLLPLQKGLADRTKRVLCEPRAGNPKNIAEI